MRPALTILLLVFAALQVQLWGGSGSLTEVRHLQHAIATQERRNAELHALNDKLVAEVRGLKNGVDAVEELARSELAMTGANETFYHITELPKPAGPELPADVPSPENP